ncbi:hypothetical protein WFC_00087 [Escherichia phage vB_EcoM_WFC]|uniref:Uncharacterized protein n=1 Tax=Escherichia phage vB_EcoM_WFC TaxID=2508193 RepID=A0A482MVP0_9CAUD|nr:hypothetical protein HOV52_gp087 [Escherichia phage vB_EcoM_WFC]QBQ77479.1 hypothetical protein WFC_00087 [Escherichia phage vB_EcoM_WFC]
MIIHRPLMLKKEECEEILHALRRAEADVNLRIKVRDFIMKQFENDDVDYAIDELLNRNVKGATRPICHQSRCARVPIQNYVHKKPRLKPVPADKIEVGDVIVCVYYGSQIFNAVVVRRYSINGCQYMEVTNAKKEPGSLNVAYALREFSSPSCILYKVLDHGSC